MSGEPIINLQTDPHVVAGQVVVMMQNANGGEILAPWFSAIEDVMSASVYAIDILMHLAHVNGAAAVVGTIFPGPRDRAGVNRWPHSSAGGQR